MKKRILLIVASVCLFLGLTALPAAATTQGGQRDVTGCVQTFWYQSYGPDYNGAGTKYGEAHSSDYGSATNCWSQAKAYYNDTAGHLQVVVSSWAQVLAVATIPAGGFFLYSDHNFWNTTTGSVWGYRKYAIWHV